MKSHLRSTDSVTAVPSREWDSTVQELGGDPVYHSFAYHRASAELEGRGAEPVLLRYDEANARAVIPLLLRPVPASHSSDATSAYGYGGPLASSPVPLRGFGAAVDAWACLNRVASSFIRYHPLLSNVRLGPEEASPRKDGSTIAWEIGSRPDLMQAMHAHHRRAVRRADKSGLTVNLTLRPELANFRAMYEETMRRQGARQYYFFPDGYWERIRADLGDRLLLISGTLGGATVASLLCFVGEPFLHYHLGASSAQGRTIGATNRLFLSAAQWGRSEGLQQFHLGGGLGGSETSSLFVFKQRFDPESAPHAFHTGRWIHDVDLFATLTGSTNSAVEYFPPWRAPEALTDC